VKIFGLKHWTGVVQVTRSVDVMTYAAIPGVAPPPIVHPYVKYTTYVEPILCVELG
jgi:hypothetical protein